MDAWDDEGVMMTPRVDAAVDVDSPRSEVVDGDIGGVGVGVRGELRDDEESEVFEEAVEGIQQPVVLEQQFGDGNGDGDVIDPSVLEKQHELPGESPDGTVDIDNKGDAAGGGWQSEKGDNFRAGVVEENVEGSLGRVGGGLEEEEIGPEVMTSEVGAGERNNFEEADTKLDSFVPPLEQVETDQDNDHIESIPVDAKNLKNELSDYLNSTDGENFVTDDNASYEDGGVQLQDEIVVREADDNLQRKISDDNVDTRPEVLLQDLSEGVETDDKEAIGSSDSRADGMMGMSSGPVDAHNTEQIVNAIDRPEFSELESDRGLVPDQVEGQLKLDEAIPDLREQPEFNNGSQECATVEDVYGSSSDGPVDAHNTEQIVNAIDRPEFSELESDRGFVPDQVEGQLKSDEATPDLREQPEFNNGSQESVTVEDVYESSSDGDNGERETQAATSVAREENQTSAPSLPSRPAGLGSSATLLEPSARSVQHSRVNGSAAQRQVAVSEDAVSAEVEEYDETREKLQMIRVKFLRLAYRLGQTPHNVVVAQVLYRLGLAEQLRGSASRAGAFSFDRASAMAEQLEAAGQEPLDFSCTIMVIGKTGVGKSATINSIFDESKFKTDAFSLGTKKVQDTVGTVQGIKVRVVDTPGLLPSLSDQSKNEKILKSVKNFIKKTPPDVIMYLDRLDMQNRDMGDIPLLRTITNVFGPSIWFNAIVVLTHAASAPPEGANGSPLSYEMYVSQRTHVIQNAIRQAAGDPRLLNPVSLVENHSACRTNRAGQRVLPNGQVWKPHLLLLSFASKILTEANTLLRLQDSPSGRPFGARSRMPPLPFFLSSLLQSKPQLKLPDDQFVDDDVMDIFVDEDADSGEETDYEDLPPFRSLTREQLSQLSNSQRKSYYEEIDYSERLLFRRQMREERKRRKLRKKMAAAATEEDQSSEPNSENLEDENGGPASVPVPMPDLALPASFDSDYPSHRYRFLDSSQWLVRPVLETQGWDHDVGYEGVNAEKMFILKDKIPVSVSGQLMKDKKECSLQMEVASSIKHGEAKASSFSMDVQTVGKDMAYTLRGETRVNNFKRNSMLAAVSATLLGDTTSAGLKIEDRLIVNKLLKLLVSGGVMTGRGDVAYGGRLEATLRDRDYPIGKSLTTLALSLVDWHGDLAIAGNIQSQIPLGRNSNLIGHVNWSNRGSGQLGIRLNSSEQLQIALIALIPLFRNAKRLLLGSREFTQ